MKNEHLIIEDIYGDSITNLFARFVNVIYVDIDVNKYEGGDDYTTKLSKKFKLNPQYEYTIIEAFYWTLEDSEIAIQNFKEYGIGGITKLGNNEGERYLRLYGLLAAVYNQRSAIVKMYEVFDLGTHKQLKDDFRKLAIIEARHMVASHAFDYVSLDKKKDYFRISRPTLNDDEKLLILGKNGSHELNVLSALQEFQEFINQKYKMIGAHLIARFYQEGSDKHDKLSKMLDYISRKIDNHHVRMKLMNTGFIDLTNGQAIDF